jgi:homoserine O-acetyltransferase
MPETIPADSVGLVKPQMLAFDTPLALDCGRSLSS